MEMEYLTKEQKEPANKKSSPKKDLSGENIAEQ